MAHFKNWTDNVFQIFLMGTSWVAVSINNIKTLACGGARYLPSLIALFDIAIRLFLNTNLAFLQCESRVFATRVSRLVMQDSNFCNARQITVNVQLL